MTDITPKTRLEGQRGHVIHTRSWDALVEFYRDLISKRWPFLPMLRLVEAMAVSPAATQIHGATSMADLLLSACEDFRIGDSTLRVSYRPDERRFYFYHHSFSGHDDQKTCTEAEVMQTLRLFLRLKYGVLFEPPLPSDQKQRPLAKHEFRCFQCYGIIRVTDDSCSQCGWTWG
jgi:hypothetical protein